MALTLIATPAASDANSYCTVAEGDAYHESRLFTDTWTDASAAEKATALVMATRLLDAFYSWTGDAMTQPKSPKLPKGAYYAWTGLATTSTQALCWPRTGMLTRNGYAIESGEIPNGLKDATAEFARQLLAADRTADNDVEAQGLKSLSAGPVSLSFQDMVYRKLIPDAVHELLVPSWCIVYGGSSLFKVL